MILIKDFIWLAEIASCLEIRYVTKELSLDRLEVTMYLLHYDSVRNSNKKKFFIRGYFLYWLSLLLKKNKEKYLYLNRRKLKKVEDSYIKISF